MEHLEVRSLLAVTLVPEQAIWQNDGPSPIYSFPVVSGTGATIQANGIASNAGQFSGAIQTIAAHPTDANTIYVGGVNGGVWQTTDGGTNWTALTDNLPSLAIADLAISPADPKVVYAATGSLSSFSSQGGRPVGIYKLEAGKTPQILGGQTFGLTTITGFNNQQYARRIRRVVPTHDPNVILAATDAYVSSSGNATNLTGQNGQPVADLGIYRSADGGQTWTAISNGISRGAVTDLVRDPVNRNLYAAIPTQGIYKSVDNGLSWTLSSQVTGESIRLAIHNSNAPAAPVTAKPGIVSQNAPATNTTTPTFSWGAVPTAASYELYVSPAGQTGNPVIRQANITGTTFQAPTALPPGRYQSWVKASNARGAGAWSAVQNFTIGGATPTIAINPPTGTGTGLPTLSWNQVAGATSYYVWVNKIGGQQAIINQNSVQGTAFTALNNLADGTYRAWVRVNGGQFDKTWSAPIDFTLARTQATATTGNNVVYAGIIQAKAGRVTDRGITTIGSGLQSVFFTTDQGANWSQMATPLENNDSKRPLHSGQGKLHFSIAASPTDPNVVYVGGATQLASGRNGCQWPGRHLAGNRQTGAWTPLECTSLLSSPVSGTVQGFNSTTTSIAANLTGAAQNYVGATVTFKLAPKQLHPTASKVTGFSNGVLTVSPALPLAPSQGHTFTLIKNEPTNAHADSRAMVFDANGNLLEGNDGGLYKVTNLNNPALRQWTPMNAGRTVSEFVSIGWDPVSNIILGGTQDNGSPQQISPNGLWKDLTAGDGMKVGVEVLANGNSVRYYSTQHLGGFRRSTYNNQNVHQGTQKIGLSIPANPQNRFPQGEGIPFTPVWELNVVQPGRMLLGSNLAVYESNKGGDTLTKVLQATPTAIAAGGKRNGANVPGVALVGINNGLMRRQPGFAFDQQPLQSYPGSTPRDIAFDPDDWSRAWVVDSNSNVWFTSNLDTQATFINISGNLQNLGETDLNTVAVYPGTANPNDEALLVGGLTGVYVTGSPETNNPTWSRFGTATANLPTVDVRDIVYSSADNLVVIGTLGRGVWSVRNVSAAFGQQAPVIRNAVANTPVNNMNLFDDLNLDFGNLFAGADLQGGNDNQPILGIGPAAITVSDQDSTSLKQATVRLDKRPDGTAESLAVDTGNSGITAVYNAQLGELLLTGDASPTAYNEVLRTVRYVNTTPQPSTATRTVSVVVNDGTTNSNEVKAAIAIQSVSAAPLVDLNGTPDGTDFLSTFTQSGGPVSIVDTAGLLLADADSTQLASARVELNAAAGLSSELLAVTTAGSGLTSSYDTAQGVLEITGEAALATYQTVLRTLTYDNTATSPSTENRTVYVTVNDGRISSGRAVATIKIAPVATAPSVDANGAANGLDNAVEFQQGGGPVALLATATIADTDSPNLTMVTATLNAPPNGASEILTVDTSGTSVTATFNNGVLTLTGPTTVAQYQQVLRTLTYNNTATAPDTSVRTVSLLANDGVNNSSIAGVTISVNAVASAPVLDLNGADAGFDFQTEFTQGIEPAFLSDESLTLTDADSTNIASAVVSIMGRLDGQHEVLALDTETAGVTSTFADGVLTLTGPASLADFRQVLSNVTYENRAFRPTAGTRTVSFMVNDGTNNGTAAHTEVDVFPMDHAPFLDLNGPEKSGIDIETEYQEGSGAQSVVAPTLTISSALSQSLASATVFLQDFDLNPVTADDEVLAVDVAGTSISAAYDSAKGELNLTGDDSIANYEQVLRTLTYENSQTNFGQAVRLLDIVVNDGNQESPAGFSDVYLIDANDAPVLDPSVSFTLDDIEEDIASEDNIGNDTFEILFSAFIDDPTDENLNAVFDADDPDLDVSPGMAITAVDTTNGQWEYTRDSGEKWSVVTDVSNENALLLTGEINSAIRFVPNKDFHGTIADAITFRAWDQTTIDPSIINVKAGRRADTTTNGGTSAFSSVTATASITVTSVMDPPETINIPQLNGTQRPTFTWNTVPEASSYEIWLSSYGTHGAFRVFRPSSVVTEPQWTPPADLATNFHRLWIRSIDANGNLSDWSEGHAVDVKPTVIGPVSDSTSRRPNFQWNAIPGAAGYEVFVRTQDKSIGSNGDIVVTLSADETTWTPDVDLPDGVIRWWVRDSAAFGNNGWSNVARFSVDGRIAISSATSSSIKWGAIAGAHRYILHIEDESQSVVVRQDVTNASFAPATPLVSGTYRAWVKAIGATAQAGLGLWSRAFDFTVAESNERSEELNSSLLQPLPELLTKNDSTAESSDRDAPAERVFEQAVDADDNKIDEVMAEAQIFEQLHLVGSLNEGSSRSGQSFAVSVASRLPHAVVARGAWEEATAKQQLLTATVRQRPTL